VSDYDDLVAAYEAMPSDDWIRLGKALMNMIIEGPPASGAFLERVILDVASPILEDEPLPGPADIEKALDAIPSGEFLGLCAVFAEMAENRSDGSARFVRVLGRMFGSSIERRRADLDPDTRAFAEVIVGYFTDE
jgi:hypothetical protein